MALDDDQEIGDERALKAAIRSAKKSARPTKIGLPLERRHSKSSKTNGKVSGQKRAAARAAGAFERDLGQKAVHGEGVRVKKGDAVAGMGKKGARRK
jgi:ATP-dependent RNA helicase DDX27